MKRLIDYYLNEWKNSLTRKSLLLRGARQVGKTYTVREFGKKFEYFVEINFESNKLARNVFDKDLEPKRILHELSIILDKQIIPGKTLLFFDEIQIVPQGILALRYFHEQMPELHLIAAGSLLEFAIQKVGVPVGRVQFLYMYPLNFIEFLCALGHFQLIDKILNHQVSENISDLIHEKLLTVLANYLSIGGMPQSVACWVDKQNLHACSDIPQNLVEAYQYDFVKYAKSFQVKYLDLLFMRIPQQLGKKFKFSQVGEYRKRDLEPCLDLLATTGIVHKVFHSDSQGIPLGAQIDLDTFKLIFLDVGLTQFILGLKTGDWLINPLQEFVNKGYLVESFIGQELLAYENPRNKNSLYYWKRDAKGSEAEVDYVIQNKNIILPIEVKSGKGNSMKSMQLFLDSHKDSPYGVRLSTNNYSIYERIHSYPLYAVVKLIVDQDDEVKNSIVYILKN